MHKLLILSCSRAKRQDKGLLPAQDRYDGPSFRILRRFLREQPGDDLDVRILSARFGLIHAEVPIPDYDQQMTPSRARELQAPVRAQLQALTNQGYRHLFLLMGRVYLQALAGYEALFGTRLSVTLATGTPGRRLTQLHAWLRQPLEETSGRLSL